ncbi:ergosterol biosynthesis protein [Malassezia sp. CBS 17886]|nr:ergosterol biosynthesis protein [Malassezia sp. CBS 17886]
MSGNARAITASLTTVPAGVLPKWLLLVGAVAALNGLQNLVNPSFSARVYASATGRPQVTPLTARLFATWNLTSAMVRVYTAYHMHDQGCVVRRARLTGSAYLLCLGTFVIAAVHFISELLVFRTLGAATGSVSPILVASSSMVAMALQYRYYVG